MSEAQTIQIRVRDTTLAQIEDVRERVHAPSRSDAVRRAVELTDLITKALEHGDRIIIEKRGGDKTQILVPGINY